MVVAYRRRWRIAGWTVDGTCFRRSPTFTYTRARDGWIDLHLRSSGIGRALAECPVCGSLLRPEDIEGHWEITNSRKRRNDDEDV